MGSSLVVPDLDPVVIHHHMWRAVVPPACFAASIPIALVTPLGAEVSWSAIGIATVILSRIFRPRYARASSVQGANRT